MVYRGWNWPVRTVSRMNPSRTASGTAWPSNPEAVQLKEVTAPPRVSTIAVIPRSVAAVALPPTGVTVADSTQYCAAGSAQAGHTHRASQRAGRSGSGSG